MSQELPEPSVQQSGKLPKSKARESSASRGSDEKIDYLKQELQFDEAINYKTADDIQKALQNACPDGVDVYFDNVGGPISDAVMNLLNEFARIPVCGAISSYNAESEADDMGLVSNQNSLKRSR